MRPVMSWMVQLLDSNCRQVSQQVNDKKITEVLSVSAVVHSEIITSGTALFPSSAHGRCAEAGGGCLLDSDFL